MHRNIGENSGFIIHGELKLGNYRWNGNLNTSLNFSNFETIVVVSSSPETIRLPKYLYNIPKHWEAPAAAVKK